MGISVGKGADRTRALLDSERRAPARTLSILVVDDDHDLADGIAMLLRLWNHRVRVAYEGRGALEVFRRAHPDLVLTDIGLPGINGYELARRFRRIDPRAHLVALTGSTDRRRAIAAGFEEHFAKPVDTDVLRRLLSRL